MVISVASARSRLRELGRRYRLCGLVICVRRFPVAKQVGGDEHERRGRASVPEDSEVFALFVCLISFCLVRSTGFLFCLFSIVLFDLFVSYLFRLLCVFRLFCVFCLFCVLVRLELIVWKY